MLKRVNNKSAIQLLVLLLIVAQACGLKSSQKNQPAESSEIEFQTKSHNFGTVASDEELACRFTFTNVGNAPVTIQKVEVGCGCTATSYTKKPVKPSETGYVEVVFNPRNQHGYQRKSVRVYANIPEESLLLTIVANVQ